MCIRDRILDGILKISLKDGELLPASSKIIFENNEQVYRYDLSEIVFDNLTYGNFYIKGNSFDEEGYGYGIVGTKKIYPDVSFKLAIYERALDSSSHEQSESASLEEDLNQGNTEKQLMEEVISEELQQEESAQEVEEIVSEEQQTLIEEKSQAESQQVQEETSSEESSEAGVISTVLDGVSNFFLSLTLTGRAVSEEKTVQEIEGKVSFDKPFIIQLEENQEVKLVEGSVMVGQFQLDDKDIKVNIESGNVIITTDYFEIETGFGEDYIGEDEKQITVNMSALNLLLEPGELKTKLMYENKEIVSFSSFLNEDGGISSEKKREKEVEKKNLTEENFSEQEILFNETEESVVEEQFSKYLNEDENNLLREMFGNISVETAKLEVFNGRLIIRYGVGNKWIEYSYDYPGEITEEIKAQAEKDKAVWLRDLIKEYYEDKVFPEQINEKI